MAAQRQLEAKMEDMLVKNAPFQIPEKGRKAIVEWAPWLALIGAVLSFFAVISLWKLAHSAQYLANSANEISRIYGVDTGSSEVNFGVLFYVSFAVLIAQGLLMLYAFSGLKALSKSRGWDILLLSVVANFIYSFLYAFTDAGNVMSILWAVIAVVIGLYLLAQIRSHYNGHKSVQHHQK